MTFILGHHIYLVRYQSNLYIDSLIPKIYVHIFFDSKMINYSYVTGFKGKTKLLYSHDERNLYALKSSSNGINPLQYECYHNSNKENHPRCPVYCTVVGNIVRRNTERHCHPDHMVKYNDLISLNGMRNTCILLKEHCPSSGHRISLYDIFLQEIAK